jgi:hypothetical protein
MIPERIPNRLARVLNQTNPPPMIPNRDHAEVVVAEVVGAEEIPNPAVTPNLAVTLDQNPVTLVQDHVTPVQDHVAVAGVIAKSQIRVQRNTATTNFARSEITVTISMTKMMTSDSVSDSMRILIQAQASQKRMKQHREADDDVDDAVAAVVDVPKQKHPIGTMMIGQRRLARMTTRWSVNRPSTMIMKTTKKSK